ncbi:MAG: Ig-like domain-containing protein [Prevotella sp.]|nr:Ig-like domain-containing protein [Prevotella sp.]
MKYKLLRFSLLSIFAMLWGNVFAEEVTLDFTNADEITSMGFTLPEASKGIDITEAFTYNTITITPYKGTTNVRIWNSNGSYTLRYFKADSNGNKGGIGISVPEGNTISQIVITGNTQLQYTICDSGTAEMSENNKSLTWTPAEGSSVSSVKFENNGSSTTNVETIKVTYQGGGAVDTRTATTVTLGDYAASGEIGSTLDLPTATVSTIDGTPIPNATVTWSSSNETVAGIAGSRINLVSVGTTTIKASYEGDNSYKASSVSYTLTVTPAAVTVSSLSDLQAKVTSTSTPATITFNGEQVVFVNGSNAYLADANGYGALVYTKDHGLEAGQTLTGTITANIVLYQGAAEITGFTTEGLTIGTANVVPVEKTVGDIAKANQSTLVTLKNVTYSVGESDKLLSDGTNSIVYYDKFKTNVELEEGKAYDITGIVVMFNDKIEIAPRTAEDVTEAAAVEPGEWVYRDFGIDLVGILTDDQKVEQQAVEFGVVVAEDGTQTQVAYGAENANISLKGNYWNDHGWVNTEATVKVEGPVQIDLGYCNYGSGDITVLNAEGATVATGTNVRDKGCWSATATDKVATVKYTGEATTLTIKYSSYLPYIGVKAIEATSVEVAYSLGDVECQGNVLPTGGTYPAGDGYTIPAKNFTLYKEGYTLTGWSDGTQTYAAGETITLSENITLTPVFTTNEVNLSDRTEPVTVKFDFQRNNGAPSVQWQNQSNLVWVAQATVNGKTIDVPTHFTTAPGKFNNTNWGDWCQINEGTTFTVPSCKDAVVSVEAYNALSALTIDGQSDYTSGKTINYTVASSAETVDVVFSSEGQYYRYIQVVLPVVQSQGGGDNYENADMAVEWPMLVEGKVDLATYTATPAAAVSVASFEYTPTNATVATGSRSKDPDNGLVFVTFTGENVQTHWFVKPASGLTFTPTQIRLFIQRFGTNKQDGVVITAKVGDEGAVQTLGTYTARRANWDDSQEQAQWGSIPSNLVNEVVINLTEAQQANLASGEGFHLYATTGLANNKAGGFVDCRIYGKVNGTVASINKYTLTTAVAPEEAGSINVYPAADEYEEGSEVTLTATENFGYDFVNWTNAAGEEVSTEAKFKYTVNSNETLTANFVAVETYELALTVDGTNDYMVTVNPAPEVVDGKWMYEAGQAVQLIANQYEGLVAFTNWSDGETNSSKLIQMNEDIQLTAVYAQADIIAGWDFYKKGNDGRKADFYAQDNDADALNLVNTATGETSGWLDKSTEGAGGYESFAGAAVNWRTGASNGDVGNWHWQTKVNAAAFTDINVQFQMLYNYNAYQTYDAEYSFDGESWTKLGSVTMSGNRVVGQFNEQLPAEANNKAELYIRMLADKTSNVDGAASANDGNTLAMFFITGTPNLIDDGQAPVLVSTVPADGATGVSASGKIVLTFDERVKVADNAVATLGNLSLTPVVSGKSVTFDYKGLEYSTQYAFTLAGNTVADLTDNAITDAISLTFTTMERPTVEKGLFDAVCENVDQLLAAIAAAQARADKNVRYRIFIKNGEYTIPLYSTMKTCNGFELPECITFINTENMSFIGESRDGVTITNAIPATETFTNQWGEASKYEGIGNGDVFQLRGQGYYWQDLTVQSGIADSRGRNLAIQDLGTQNIYKNIGLRGYQDTWTSNNDRGLYYFEDGYVRGRTDYMCGKGDIFWNRVELRQIAGGYAAVPSKPAKSGWVYKDCTINGEGSGVDGNYTLGRPWGSGTPIALFIDTKMNVVPSAIGWNEMSGGWPKRFAEFNSTTSTGSVIDLSGRKTVFGDGHANNPVLTAEEALEAGNLHNMFDEWDPTLATEQAPVPTAVVIEGNKLTWAGSNYARCWAVCLNGSVVDFTTVNSYDIPALARSEAAAADVWTIRAANEMGGLSEASQPATVATGITTLTPSTINRQPSTYNMQGMRVEKPQKGLYIINGRKVVIK